MEMRSGGRAALVWDKHRFLRGYATFYAQGMGIQEENHIGRGAAQNAWAGFRAFWSIPIDVVLVYWPVESRGEKRAFGKRNAP